MLGSKMNFVVTSNGSIMESAHSVHVMGGSSRPWVKALPATRTWGIFIPLELSKPGLIKSLHP